MHAFSRGPLTGHGKGSCSDQYPEPIIFNIKQLEKGLDYGELGDKFGVAIDPSIACEKVNMEGTGEKLFTLQHRHPSLNWTIVIHTPRSNNKKS